MNANKFDARDVRALTEFLTVTPDIGKFADVPMMTIVTSESGNTYDVDVVSETCTCPDHEHRGNKCKHIRRAQMAMGIETVSVELVEELGDEVDDSLGAHTERDLRFETADGFQVARQTA